MCHLGPPIPSHCCHLLIDSLGHRDYTTTTSNCKGKRDGCLIQKSTAHHVPKQVWINPPPFLVPVRSPKWSPSMLPYLY